MGIFHIGLLQPGPNFDVAFYSIYRKFSQDFSGNITWDEKKSREMRQMKVSNIG